MFKFERNLFSLFIENEFKFKIFPLWNLLNSIFFNTLEHECCRLNLRPQYFWFRLLRYFFIRGRGITQAVYIWLDLPMVGILLATGQSRTSIKKKTCKYLEKEMHRSSSFIHWFRLLMYFFFIKSFIHSSRKIKTMKHTT